ncbi:COG1470 family protein [Acetomicrobium sp. S15 = DSM 107314]|uniref:COG1470 family protein n=1 Tax=Acetomicrobium sp. S15 = DSM 107314 TaxID=2529858 RepID=UPI0018E128E5|nr:NEW3 domain-containing protein [Acetomicrobium sp. S15 = DSM 107314]
MKRICLALTLIVLLLVVPHFAYSQAVGEEPFQLYAPFTGVIIGAKDRATLDVKLKNMTDKGLDVKLELERDEKAEGWEVMLLNSEWSGFGVSSLHLGTGDEDKEATVKLRIKPAEDAAAGEYRFIVKASTLDGAFSETLPIVVQLTGGKVAEEKVKTDIELEAKYPAVEGTPGRAFSYEISVKNAGGDAVVVDLTLNLPEKWSGYITPRWESERRINSIKLDGSATERILLTVTPPIDVEKKDYPVKLIAKTGDVEKALDLSAIIKGTYRLQMVPETNRLNFDMVAGEEKRLVLYLWNEGSAPIENISLLASKPEGWEVKFEPEKLSSLESLLVTQKPEQVTAIFKAPERTIPGDYQVSVTAAGDQDQKSLDLRATVKVPTSWGWAGIGVIAAVLLLLFGIFMKLKRR